MDKDLAQTLLREWAQKNKGCFVLISFAFQRITDVHLEFGALDAILSGFDRLMKRKDLDFVQGYFRSIEIKPVFYAKYNTVTFHLVLGVRRSYFKKYYISKNKWLELLSSSIRDLTLERGNFAVKHFYGHDLMQNVIDVFSHMPQQSDLKAVKGRRLWAYGGQFHDVYKQNKILHRDIEIPEKIKAAEQNIAKSEFDQSTTASCSWFGRLWDWLTALIKKIFS